jgi:hypothetical protein
MYHKATTTTRDREMNNRRAVLYELPGFHPGPGDAGRTRRHSPVPQTEHIAVSGYFRSRTMTHDAAKGEAG